VKQNEPVKRHDFDRQHAESTLAAEKQLLAHGVGIMIEQSEPRPLRGKIANAMWIAGTVSLLEPASDELCVAIRMGSSMAAGLYKLMDESPGEYPIPLGDGRIATLHNIGVTSETSGATWLDGFHLATIARDGAALAQLSSTPVDKLRRSSSKSDDCVYLWIETLQALYLRKAEAGEKMAAALEATEPSRLKLSSEDWVLNVLVPEIQCMFHLVEQEPEPFNAALHVAVERHKRYWSSAKQKRSPVGLLALGPLACASFAHDFGMAVTVDSDYLPPRLFEGGCRLAG
jgi:hypothetical protein